MDNLKISDFKQYFYFSKNDPWELDLSAGKLAFGELKGGGQKFGKICPLKNFGKKCKVCEKAVELFNTGSKQDEVIARKIYAKKQCFFPVWMKDIQKKPFILHVPVSVAEDIIDGVYNSGIWGNIFHPTKGRLVYVSKIPPKTPNDWTSYKTTPDPDGTHKLPSIKILEYIPDLETIVDKLKDNDLDDIRSLKEILQPNETIGIRFLPNPKDPSKPPLKIVWTHYVDDVTMASLEDSSEVSSDELIDGEAPFDVEDDEIPDFEEEEEEISEDDDIFA